MKNSIIRKLVFSLLNPFNLYAKNSAQSDGSLTNADKPKPSKISETSFKKEDKSVFREEESNATYPFFIIMAERGGSTLEFDSINKIAMIKWQGTVTVATASRLVTLGASAVNIHGYSKLILDRSNLKEFDTEARIWIKNMLKSEARKISHKVEKLAIVNSTSIKGSVFSNMISSAISLIMPGLTLKKFDTSVAAINWVMEKSEYQKIKSATV